MTARRLNRFSSPSVLTDDSRILGATVKDWDKALTGNIDKTLAELKKRVLEDGEKRAVSKTSS
jgi:hypothetical protein